VRDGLVAWDADTTFERPALGRGQWRRGGSGAQGTAPAGSRKALFWRYNFSLTGAALRGNGTALKFAPASLGTNTFGQPRFR
jgi:hypothetical protein